MFWACVPCMYVAIIYMLVHLSCLVVLLVASYFVMLSFLILVYTKHSGVFVLSVQNKNRCVTDRRPDTEWMG